MFWESSYFSIILVLLFQKDQDEWLVMLILKISMNINFVETTPFNCTSLSDVELGYIHTTTIYLRNGGLHT